jgi:hypothetical protein
MLTMCGLQTERCCASTDPAQLPFLRNRLCFSEQRSMSSERKPWEDMAPTERLAAIRELAEQLKAHRDDRAPRHEADEAQPIQLRPSVCSRVGQAFLVSAAISLDHSAARFNLSQHRAWNFSPATERDAGFYFGEERPRHQKLVGLIEDVTDCKKQSLHAKFAHVAKVIGNSGVYVHRS